MSKKTNRNKSNPPRQHYEVISVSKQDAYYDCREHIIGAIVTPSGMYIVGKKRQNSFSFQGTFAIVVASKNAHRRVFVAGSDCYFYSAILKKVPAPAQ